MKTQNSKQTAKKAPSKSKAAAGSAPQNSSSKIHPKLKEEDSYVIADVLSKPRKATAGFVEIATRHNKLAG